ncbi:MAG: hypothetical protein M3203_11710 [Actinomycetota bacterium]|nr:hypothetical protein [Actinomycetota bacterium]
MRAAREMPYDTVLVTGWRHGEPTRCPYGGVRQSGNTKEGPPSAVTEMTEERLVVIGT